MNVLISLLTAASLTALLASCSASFHQPTLARRARLGEETPATVSLRQLPAPKEKVVAAVYKFRDLTGQYKQSETGAGFSTAVTQGTTNILLKALEESGWFVPIERENFSNLVNERRIVSQSVSEFKEGEKLPPLLFAGILLEGGVVSYDANIITGGGGLRYFGAGASTQYRQDRVTVYLRAVATKTGRILKTIYTSKTILSQSIDASLFRYVAFKRLLETETGLTTNEPGQLAVTEAIEKAVEGMIIEGAQEGLWAPADQSAEAMKRVFDTYNRDKAELSQTDAFAIRRDVEIPFLSVQPYVGAWQYSGDYARKTLQTGYGAAVEVRVLPSLGLQLNGSCGRLASEGAFKTAISTLEGNLVVHLMPYQRWSSLLYAGAGLVAERGTFPTELRSPTYFQAQVGGGVHYSATQRVGLRATLSYNQPFTDALDRQVIGQRNDYYLRGTMGLTINLGRSRQSGTKPTVVSQTTSSH
ncbi:CsgG/HfaB family protein [Spirosoma gilvum]